MSAYKTLSYVVMNYLNESGDFTMQNYKRYLQIVCDGIRQLNLYNLTQVKVVYLVPNSANIVELPDDYVQYTKIGIMVSGRLWTLTLNKNIVPPRDIQCGMDIRVTNSGLSTFPYGGYNFVDHWYGDRFITGLYGLGGGLNTGYFNIDSENKTIVLDGCIFTNQIILEYKTDGIGEGTPVPPQAIEPLKKRLDFLKRWHDPRVGIGEKQLAKQLMDESIFELQCFENIVNLDEWMDSFYESSSQSPKR